MDGIDGRVGVDLLSLALTVQYLFSLESPSKLEQLVERKDLECRPSILRPQNDDQSNGEIARNSSPFGI